MARSPGAVLVSMALPAPESRGLAYWEACDLEPPMTSSQRGAAAATPAGSPAPSAGALRRAVTVQERAQVQELPDLMGRIADMGLTGEYITFRERYLGWRKGKHSGASGDLSHDGLAGLANRGWGFWYPSMQVWQWRRTLSYWIAVTFFEGSIFFTVSSFLWCYPEYLGDLKVVVTVWGYIGGKVNFIICTYLMCLQTINLSNADEHVKNPRLELPSDESSGASSDDSSDAFSVDEHGQEKWRWSPFHVRLAIRKLNALGAGPWPYWASFMYFLGVIVFGIGLIFDLLPRSTLEEEVAAFAKNVAFFIGAFLFVLGGAAECIENGVFSGCDVDAGWIGAFLNLMGSVWFQIGSIIAFIPGQAFLSSFSFGIGSLAFVLGSGVMIVMWKDEQFGLTFLAVLNRLGGAHGRPIVERLTNTGARDKGKVEEEKTLSRSSAFFIMVYCLMAALSWYDFLISLRPLLESPNPGMVLERAFNAFLPFIFAHFMLALTAGVFRTPKVAPFRQLYIGCRILAIIMCVISGARFVQAIQTAHCVRIGVCTSESAIAPVLEEALLTTTTIITTTVVA